MAPTQPSSSERKPPHNRTARTEGQHPQRASPSSTLASGPASENATHTDEPPASSSPPTTTTTPPAPTVDEAFAQFYLRQATREFAGDLEVLRGARDFRAAAAAGGVGTGVEVLVAGLRQGVWCFGGEERGRVVGWTG
ncbi:Ribosome assembly protein [Teratosphaeria destructans]|uniref:Ribosome assembly protein n=1 Tax=Teratosphaeria destructans TaxID=418781 RepID=A0A9W7STU2_9PEZI|nr:Ribosome assembly protein [Teratosphaeria destructans]